MAQELGEIPPSDPVSRIIKGAIAEKKAPLWEDIFAVLSKERADELAGTPQDPPAAEGPPAADAPAPPAF